LGRLTGPALLFENHRDKGGDFGGNGGTDRGLSDIEDVSDIERLESRRGWGGRETKGGGEGRSGRGEEPDRSSSSGKSCVDCKTSFSEGGGGRRRDNVGTFDGAIGVGEPYKIWLVMGLGVIGDVAVVNTDRFPVEAERDISVGVLSLLVPISNGGSGGGTMRLLAELTEDGEVDRTLFAAVWDCEAVPATAARGGVIGWKVSCAAAALAAPCAEDSATGPSVENEDCSSNSCHRSEVDEASDERSAGSGGRTGEVVVRSINGP